MYLVDLNEKNVFEKRAKKGEDGDLQLKTACWHVSSGNKKKDRVAEES